MTKKAKFYPKDFSVEDLFDAYFDCRKCKRNTLNQLAFEADLETNLMELYYDLKDGPYTIGSSIAFVIEHPKIREIWAADFRDRIVHHLIYNAISEYYYRRFIRDCYACIPGRGTHDGLARMSGFARSVSRNYTRNAFALKVDVANFFNAINRHALEHIIKKDIGEGWCLDLLLKVIWHDPRKNMNFRSSPALFRKVPKHKSLMQSELHRGLPIGNLTSQFFANVYMNELDQFVKHKLKCRYYGRYVDDMVLFHENPNVLNKWRYEIDAFLQDKLSLHLHPNKIWLNRVDKGIDFVGFLIKPGRVYLRQSSLDRCRQKIRAWERKGAPVDEQSLEKLSDSVTSYLGMMRHINGYNARCALSQKVQNLFIRPDLEYTKLIVSRGRRA